MAELAELESGLSQIVEKMEGQKAEMAELRSSQGEVSQSVSQLSDRIGELEGWRVEVTGADEGTDQGELLADGDLQKEQKDAILRDFLGDLTKEDWLKIGEHHKFLDELEEGEEETAVVVSEESPTDYQARFSDEGGDGWTELPPEVAEKMPMGMKWVRIEAIPAVSA